MLRLLAHLLPLTLVSPAVAQETETLRTEVVEVHHVNVHDADAALRPLVSPVGTLHPSAGLGTLTIIDRPYVVETMLELLDKLDQPKPHLEFTVFLVVAGEKSGRSGEMNHAELTALMAELRRGFPHDSYRILDRGAVRLAAGDRATLRVGGKDGWDLELDTRGTTDGKTFGVAVHLHSDELVGFSGEAPLVESKTVVRTTLEVKHGQTTAVGASKLEGDRTLVTVLMTKVVKPG